jgi:hypothetical protein
MDFLIYYGDGDVIQDTSPFEIHKRSDVQVIIQPDENVVWYSQCGDDYYIWRNRRWWGVDIFGLFDYLLQSGRKCVLFGRTIDNKDFQRIFMEAKHRMKELTGHEKVAYKPEERKP